MTPTVHRGAAFLERYLEANGFDFREASLEDFEVWLAGVLRSQERNQGFLLRSAVRDLIREHRSKLRYRERRLRKTREALEAQPDWHAAEALNRSLESSEQAVGGLTEAVAEGRADPAKLEAFRQQLHRQRTQREELLSGLSEYGAHLRAQSSMARFRELIGLDEAEAAVERHNRARGHRSSDSGERFETVSAEVIEKLVATEFAKERGAEVICLHGVSLGSARAELDHVLVLTSPSGHVEVLAVVEAKRNPNDLGHGFSMRQENIAWFVGDQSLHDCGLYRTSVFTEGAFVGEAIHREGQRDYVFSKASFARFRRDPVSGYYLEGLWFVTEARRLMGLDAGDYSRLTHRLATDPYFDATSRRKVAGLFRKTRESLPKTTSLDVLRIFAAQPAFADQVLFLDPA